MMSDDREHRLKILSIDPNSILDIFNWWRNPPDIVRLPVSEEVPEDAVVTGVYFDHLRLTLDFVISSSQFPVGIQGQMLERINGVVREFRHVPFSSLPLNSIENNPPTGRMMRVEE